MVFTVSKEKKINLDIIWNLLLQFKLLLSAGDEKILNFFQFQQRHYKFDTFKRVWEGYSSTAIANYFNF